MQSMNGFRLAAFIDLTDTGGTLDGAKVALFKNNLTLNPTTVYADLDIVTETGMEAFGPVVWNSPNLTVDGGCQVTGANHAFLTTSVPTTPFVVYGWAILNTAGTYLFYAELLDEPVPVDNAPQGVIVTPTVVWGA